MIALDWEKAFDRVSWDYLLKAMDALGYGPIMRGWIGRLYNLETPPMRVIKANGTRSEPFPIRSGVAQGCVCSPILFLFVAEALTRMVESESEEEPGICGIWIGEIHVRVCQFADDTLFFLRSYSALRRMWELIKTYE
jgi:hypothetical protein